MQICGGLVYTADRAFEKKTIQITGERFVTCARGEDSSDERMEADGLYVIPGLIDLHFHGCFGADVCDATRQALETIVRYEAGQGVTALCPATMSLPAETLFRVMTNLGSFDGSVGAELVGIHMEGPFLSKEKKGAQKEEYLQTCDTELFHRLQRASGGKIKIVDVAPEMENGIKFVEEISKECVVSIAHTAASYEQAGKAFMAGASHVTHLFNAMSSFGHREPGVIGAAVDDGKCKVELICDGVHVHPAAIRSAFRLFGEERILVISDSMRATGLGDGEYSLGGQSVTVSGSFARLSDGTIAGSVSSLMDCLRYLVKKAGIPLETALRCTTENPAKELGIYGERGSIEDGKIADCVLLNKELEVVKVIIRGSVFDCNRINKSDR